MYSALIEDGVTNLTAHELLYILGTVSGENSTRAAEQLDLPVYDDPQPVLTAGLTSLYARGMVEVSDEAVQLSEVAALAGYVLTASDTWLELAFVGKDGIDAGWLVRREQAAILLTPRRLGTFELRVLNPELNGQWLADIAFDFLTDRPSASFYVTRDQGADETGLAVRRLEDGSLQLSTAPDSVTSAPSIDAARELFRPVMAEFMS
jgi:hypothetical protein